MIAAPDAGGLWFLWVLFLINLMVLTCRQLAPRSAMATAWGLWVVLSAIVLVRPEWNVLGLKLLCWHLPFFLLGMAFRKSDGMSYLHPVSALVCRLLFFGDTAAVGEGPVLVRFPRISDRYPVQQQQEWCVPSVI